MLVQRIDDDRQSVGIVVGTKVFTALLLAEMVQRGEIALADPVATYLPSHVTVPHRNGRQISLQDLSGCIFSTRASR